MHEEGVESAVFESKRDLPRFIGDILDFHLTLLVDQNPRTDPINEEDIEWVYQHFTTFDRLAANSEVFRFALEAAIDWRYAKDVRAAIARLWSGIEAIFGVTSELVYRISLLSASLLEPRGEKRKAKFEAIKKLYGIRSKAVHGESLSEEILSFAMNDSSRLLRDLLLLTIEKGHVLGLDDFDEAIFF
ncbi:MAG: hypothetical protein ACE5JS_23070 [Nitrospinota bacterium]